jgi:hypothetical protein
MDMEMEHIERKSCSACQDLLVESSFSHRQWMVGPKRRCWQCNMQNKKTRNMQSDECYFDGVVEIITKVQHAAIPAAKSPHTRDRASSPSMSLNSSDASEQWVDDQHEEWFLIEEAMLGEPAVLGAACD